MALTSLSVGRGWALPLLFLACAASAFRQDRGLSPDNATEWTTDYASAAISDSPEYDRCKTTHRCNRAFAEYDVDIGRYLFRQERFSGGRQENADLFLAFEDWKAGTVGLGVDHVRAVSACVRASPLFSYTMLRCSGVAG